TWAGYFGFRLGHALAGQGATVFLLDLHKPPWDIPDGAVFQQIDIRDYDALYKICAGVDVIYHTASYGMSGPEQLRRKQIESVNVGGTNNRGISKLIYTSTVNVAFAGRPIEDGEEDSVPCVPLDMHIDHYSRTKAIAEHMVLAANGRSTKGGGLLHTCVLRPSGIYGPGERRHLHRVNVERRLFSFCFGDPNAKMNWVHVDNLVMAHVLAADALTADKAFSGQVYFINDGESVNVFEWLTPLFERLGYGRPLIHLPVSLVYSAGGTKVKLKLKKKKKCLFILQIQLVSSILVFSSNSDGATACGSESYNGNSITSDKKRGKCVLSSLHYITSAVCSNHVFLMKLF
uniref:Putative short-chain dehydrogenase/reductase family 42E member 2 n=1 Tax=Sinocyclocheilus rhinocerous TaxID=307959 RepID=A0A673FTD2_9TELE